ncbi:EVE domain-containing protein [Vulcanisaeta sp. JCM 14467]|uniref:EVE domain-containing protein n=1 Tax=Vulcanisaeta sp. JCM 14467 TaxID=1295370 RepID=UPI0006D0047A|nr:EVE domain-containing protein [Vulcanisaeta sp. JCM 14467]
MTRVRPGTRLVVFVSGFGCKSYCKSFVGVLEVVGDWVKASSKIGDWSHVVEVKPIALGRVELGAVAGKLSFIRDRRSVTEALHSVDPANPKAMPMPPEDAELIMNELRRQSTPRPAVETLAQVLVRPSLPWPGRLPRLRVLGLLTPLGCWLRLPSCLVITL